MTEMNDRKARLARLLGPGQPELSCEDCFTELDRYVDVQAAGGDADNAVPGMASHLAGCPACTEEHMGLLAFVRMRHTEQSR
jgi:hypothetical protein